ncbi:HAD-superfamily hydrolase, subfamily IG, 5'-nucleotidase [Corchorus capsularis]|uniref:HAD-superfamily hydrolase, subfamily IG, 5'-nucleotidase n=1 Tax=Corchorus capsularis TaxID=210143 RepID=A0A1R3HK80_COCAP|nr:HAD-superfamily hydrolase, subfamily IG, 5'-nucleotidase [Corchorus capsularis]
MANSNGEKPCVWSSPGGCKIDIGKQIFCNRSLNMRNIVAVGFDMDYNLAQYKPETFESLAYGGTIRILVYDLGYPQEFLKWTFDWKYMVRGLVLDKKRGNILKLYAMPVFDMIKTMLVKKLHSRPTRMLRLITRILCVPKDYHFYEEDYSEKEAIFAAAADCGLPPDLKKLLERHYQN